MYEAVIDGKPVAAPRPRVTRRGITYMPKAYVAAKAAISAAVEDWEVPSPATLQVIFAFQRPKNEIKGKAPSVRTKRPDIDNCLKTIMDALSVDDNRIGEVRCCKLDIDGEGYTHIKITKTEDIFDD